MPSLLPLPAYYNNDYNNYTDDDDHTDNDDNHYADYNNDCAVSFWRPIYLALCQSLFTAIYMIHDYDIWMWVGKALYADAYCGRLWGIFSGVSPFNLKFTPGCKLSRVEKKARLYLIVFG